jgi:hypothetical protein
MARPRSALDRSRVRAVLIAGLVMLVVVTMALQQAASGMFYLAVRLDGFPAVVAATIVALLFLLAAIALFRRKTWGWWLTLVLTAVSAIVWLHAAVTRNEDALAWQTYVANDPVQMKIQESMLPMMLWAVALVYTLTLLYVIWLKRYFRSAPAPIVVTSDRDPA